MGNWLTALNDCGHPRPPSPPVAENALRGLHSNMMEMSSPTAGAALQQGQMVVIRTLF
jgi:hypothetical protein